MCRNVSLFSERVKWHGPGHRRKLQETTSITQQRLTSRQINALSVWLLHVRICIQSSATRMLNREALLKKSVHIEPPSPLWRFSWLQWLVQAIYLYGGVNAILALSSRKVKVFCGRKPPPLKIRCKNIKVHWPTSDRQPNLCPLVLRSWRNTRNIRKN